MERKKILIFPAGSEIAFEIVQALKDSKFVELYGGTSVCDHSEYKYQNLIDGFPHITEPNFLSYLNRVIEEYGLGYIYPAHDSVSMYLSQHIEEINATVILSESRTVEICRSKKKTYRFFEGESFIPITFENVLQINEYPVFIKPAVGQGAQGAKIINSPVELEYELEKGEDIVICEYMPGEEYTIDCFTDRFGELRVVKQRTRERIRSGIAVHSKEVCVDKEVKRIAEIINLRLKFRGAWFFQVKQTKDRMYKLLEISPRIPGTMGLSRNMGINFPLLTLFDFWGNDVNIIENDYGISLDRAFYSAYKIDCEYEHVYVDYDDTLIINKKVNKVLIVLLYQLREKKKQIHMITKHIGNIYEDLEKYRIAETLFDDIILLKPEEDKTDYIKFLNAIFIDDSFAERKRVKEVLGIPVFDVDMIECLLDWRV